MQPIYFLLVLASLCTYSAWSSLVGVQHQARQPQSRLALASQYQNETSSANDMHRAMTKGELACRLEVYASVLQSTDRERVKQSQVGPTKPRTQSTTGPSSNRELVSSNRLIFLVPLMVIYWIHHNPHGQSELNMNFERLLDITSGYDMHKRTTIEKLLIGFEREATGRCLARSLAPSAAPGQAADTARQSGSREIRHWINAMMNLRPSSRPDSELASTPASSGPVDAPTKAPSSKYGADPSRAQEPERAGSASRSREAPIESLYADIFSSFSSILSELDEKSCNQSTATKRL